MSCLTMFLESFDPPYGLVSDIIDVTSLYTIVMIEFKRKKRKQGELLHYYLLHDQFGRKSVWN